MFEVVVITDNGANVERVRCTLRHCTIGKSRDNLVQIRGWRVAQVHCKVELTDKGLYVEDVSEGSGVSVNGNKVPFYGPIRSSDVISIGSYDFRLGAVEGSNQDSGKLAGSSVEPVAAVQKVASDEEWSMQTYIGGALGSKTAEDRVGEIERQRMFMWRNRIHQEVLRMMDLKRTDVGSMDELELKQKVEG